MNIPSKHSRGPESAAARGADGEASLPTQAPRVDIWEDAEGITLRADMPGVPREHLQVQVDGDTLTLGGALHIPLTQDMQPFYAEMRGAAWKRSFTLSRELDTGAIQANLKDGVLELRIPKAEHARPRKVSVQLG